MCGIAGIINAPTSAASLRQRLEGMRAALRQRGPDDSGSLNVDSGTGFVHTRLAVLDLTPAGHQPMTTDDGRFAIVFNGEIYNYIELREELLQQGVKFRSRSDTEVILRLYERVGSECVSKLRGMYAFAIWDNRDRTCYLARDPLGIKPLYVWEHHGALAFASEVRALLCADLGSRTLCASALEQYLLYGSVQEPATLVQGIQMLSAGHSLHWHDGVVRTTKFWALRFEPQAEPIDEAIELTRTALQESVRSHLVSDVPVGLFLSGGMDSTAIAALTSSIGGSKLETFCISFDEQEFNEGDLAARTAAHFGTYHHDRRITAQDGRALLSEFLEQIDQPSNDGFNTFCISKVAREHGLKVVMSGLGGDELFGGYKSFVRVPQMMAWHRRLAVLGPFGRFAGRLGERHAWGVKSRRLSAFLSSRGGVDDAYWAVRAFFTPHEARILVRQYCGEEIAANGSESIGANGHRETTTHDQVAFLEMSRYMRNQLLRDSDVMSMAWGLELRVPLVDQRLVEAVGSVPAAWRCAPHKELLRRAVPEIPPWIANQPKRGFRFPFERWMRELWSDAFGEIEQTSPVPLQTWYRVWCLFTLNHFLKTNRIDAGAKVCGVA